MEAVLAQLGIALNYTQELLIVALIMARTVTMIQLTPFLGGKIVPLQIKMGLTAVITILIWPMARKVVNPADIPVAAIPFLLLMLKEVMIGFVIGFINAHIFWVMDMAGRLMDTARATSMSEVQDPHSKKRMTPTGDMYTQLFLIIFVTIGGHHIFFKAYFYSFEQLPVSASLDWTSGHMSVFMDHILHVTAEI